MINLIKKLQLMSYCRIKGRISLADNFDYTMFALILKKYLGEFNVKLVKSDKIDSMFFFGPGLNSGNFNPFAFLSQGVINFDKDVLCYEASFLEGVWALSLGMLFIGIIVAYALGLNYLLIVIPAMCLVFLNAFKDAGKNLGGMLEKALRESGV